MGGSPQQAPMPTAPSTNETTREAIQAQIDTGPQLAEMDYQNTMKYSPLYAQLQTQLQQDYGQQLGSSYYDMVSASNPYISGVEEAAATDILGRLNESDADMMDAYRREFNAAEASAGRLGTTAGSVNLSRQMVQAKEAIKQSRINEALSLSGKTPVTAASSIQPTTPNTSGAYVNSALGSAASIYGAQAGMYNAGVNAQSAARGQNMDMLGKFVPTVGFKF